MASIRIRLASNEEIVAAEQHLAGGRHQTASQHEADRTTVSDSTMSGQMGGGFDGKDLPGHSETADHYPNGSLEVRIPQAQGDGAAAFCT